jgi:Helicase HerA, central domain/TraM recognition site of TraD and TraG
VRVVLSVPAGNERGPQYMDQALATLHQANRSRLPVTLEFCRHENEVALACRYPRELRAVVESQLYAQYPECHIAPLLGSERTDDKSLKTWTLDLHLHRQMFPIKRFTQFEDALNRVSSDPLTSLLSTLAREKREEPLDARVEITVRPAARWIRWRAVSGMRRLAGPFFRHHHLLAHVYADWVLSPRWTLRFLAWCLGRCERSPESPALSLTTTPGRQHDREEDVQAAADKLGRLLFSTHIRLCVTGRPDDEDVAEQKLREMAGAFGQFAAPRLASFHPVKKRRWQRHSTFLLSTEELATLWHLPTLTVRAPTMTAVESREMEPPVRLPTKQEHADMAVLGQTEFRGSRQRFGILPEDRRRHLAIVGKTGMGKTTLLHHLILSDIRAGRGVALLDPHGDLSDSLLASIPRERTNDVILFDAADTMHPLSFNLLHCPRPEQRPLVASGIVSSFKKLYGEFWGPRMEHILRNAVLALLEVPGSTLLSILRILTDTKFRQPLVAKLKDPVVRAFWESEFASLPKKFQLEAVAPIQNKIGHFVSSPLLRNILGQSRSNLDLRSAMDDGKILLVNLSKGRLGDDVSALLGSFLVTALQLAAMSRADIAESERRDFFLYIDEFQNFATDSFATILSEARKYRLALILANQYLGQLDEETLLAVWGNCGSLISFQVGASDAEPLALQFGGNLTAQDLMRLPRYQAYVRLLVEGMPSRPFSMRTLAPGAPADRERPGIIRRTSRQRYARPLAQVEREIAAALAR